jgi:serine/threonine-protein kinase
VKSELREAGPFAVLNDRYALRELIGRGGAGEVFRARDTRGLLARDVCLKRIAAPLAPELVLAMREEARLLASVRHANVVSLLDVGQEENGAPYLVLELIEGWNLCALSRALAAAPPCARFEALGFLPDRVAVYVACAVLRALGAVQRALPGLVHRDVTPHNVLVSNEGEVKLSDFGIALALDRARWTRPNVVKGKLGYVAPEYMLGRELDPRADLFAVGVLLFELLSRVRPWGSARGAYEGVAIARGQAIDLGELRPDLDSALVSSVHRLFAYEPRDRFDRAEDALRAIAPWSAGDLGSLRLAAILERLGERE